ncbi:hypothetical protein [Nocardia rhamnosiphila]
MSDRPVEDEIMAEVRKFGHSMAHMMRLHAQAATWWDKRQIRRQISLELRRQRRTEQTERAHHLSWTSQMIHRYQQHIIAIDQRATDPQLSWEQHQKDAASVARHGLELRQRIVSNTRLTKIEQGIALDGLDAATAFPYTDTRMPMLFARAHKVRGIDALRYRARVARELKWFDRQQPTREQAPQPPYRPAPEPVSQEPRPEVTPSELEEVKERIRKLAEAQEERDRQIAVLQQGLESVTADRDELRTQLDAAEARVRSLEARNRDLGREVDRYRGERDEAVRKVARMTPEDQRYGSRARRDADNDGEAENTDPAPKLDKESGRHERDSVLGRRASFLTNLRHRAATERDNEVMSERLRDWVQKAPDEVLLSYGEKKGLIPPEPSAPSDQAEPALRAAFDRADCLRNESHTQPWPEPGRNGHHRNGIERSR